MMPEPRPSPVAKCAFEDAAVVVAKEVGLAVAPWACGATALSCGWGLIQLFPNLALGLFARATAVLTGLFTGIPAVQIETGWCLAFHQVPVVVTEACSATDYFSLVAGLIAWRLAAKGTRFLCALFLAIFLSLPVTLGVNAIRVLFVACAHRWIIPLMPESFAHFLHLTAGVAIFLPSLVILNLVLEAHGKSSHHSSIGK